MKESFSQYIQPIMLVGFMGAGKSTIGELISRMLNLEFIDTDREIEKELGMPISDIFKTAGEKAFREIETTILKKVQGKSGTIVACGGGIILNEENRKILKENTFVIWLKCPLAICLERSDNGKRPLLNNPDVLSFAGKLLGEREPFYNEVADMVIETNGAYTQSIAEDIVRRLKNSIRTISASNQL